MYNLLQKTDWVLIALSSSILMVYGLSTLRIVVKSALIKGAVQQEALRVRSILGICYAALFVKFIFKVVDCFRSTGYISLELVSRIATPTALVFTLILLQGSCVAVAFVVNFSRAVFTLNSLEHGTFDDDNNFGTHLNTNLRRLAEFCVRLGCASSFIGLERTLNAFISTPFESHPNLLLKIGVWAGALYLFLFIWWWTNKKFGYDIPKRYLIFYILGLILSLFYILVGLADYAGYIGMERPYLEIRTLDVIDLLLIAHLVVTFVLSLAMIGLVGYDCIRTAKQQWQDNRCICKEVFTEIRGCFK